MRTCTACGAQLTEFARFCSNCGEPLMEPSSEGLSADLAEAAKLGAGLPLAEQVSAFRTILLRNIPTPAGNLPDESESGPILEACEERAKEAIELYRQMTDPKSRLAITLAAAELPWPPYLRGDGYWPLASDISYSLTQAGLEEDDSGLLATLVESLAVDSSESAKWALAYLDLGLVGNSLLDREAILRVVSRSAVDPVRAIASMHSALEREDVAGILQQMADGVWLWHALDREDGWTWPDFQDAFGLASAATEGGNCESVWQLVLAARCVQLGSMSEAELPDTVDVEWLDEFFGALEETFDDLSDLPDGYVWFTSLAEAIDSGFDVAQAAREAHWPPSDLVLASRASAPPADLAWLAEHEEAAVRAAVAANASTPLELLAALALDEDQQVREAVIGNSAATDEIRASAAL